MPLGDAGFSVGPTDAGSDAQPAATATPRPPRVPGPRGALALALAARGRRRASLAAARYTVLALQEYLRREGFYN
jgi:hypothetical protein